MASSGTIKAEHPSNGAYWSFEWSAQATSVKGETKVSYNIYRRGLTSTTWRATDCNIYATYNGSKHTILETGRRTVPTSGSNSGGTGFKNEKETSGSFTVVHDNQGDGSFEISISAYIDSGWNWEHNSFANETVKLDKNYAYSKCSAPTSVTASGIVAPNGEVTISWSGASGGTSNSINGYDVYWRITSEGYAPSTDTKSGVKEIALNENWKDGEGEATINIGEATRGHTIVFGVVTKGAAGSSYYSGIKTGGSVKVNRLPTKPSAGTVSPTIIPASGGTITFNITTGTDLDGQTVGLKYATSTTGTKTACTSSFSLEATDAGTYYFWSNDGLEDSEEYITVSVSINTKPTVDIKVSGTQLETVNTLSNATYVLNSTIILTKGDNGQQDNNTYNYYIHYSTDNNSWTKKALWENDSSLIKTIDDVRALGYFTNLATTSYYYYFSATRNDGLDTSDATDTSSTKYYASKSPALIGMYNTQDCKDIDLSDFQGYFSKALSFKFQRDTGYNSLKIFNGSVQVATISLTAAEDGLRGQWIGINLSKGQYSFTGELGHAANNFYTAKMALGSSYKIENLEAKNLTATAEFQVYTSDVIYDFSIYNTFNVSYDKLNASKYKEYGISDISSSFYAKLTVDSITGETQGLTIAQSATNGNSTTSDTLYFSLTAAQLYDMLPNIDDKNKTYKGTLTVGFIDVFGTDTNTSIDYTVNYGVIPQVSSLLIKVNNSKEVNNWKYLKEGMPLTITGVINSYNTNPKIQIQINRIKNGIESGYVDFGDVINLTSDTAPSQGTPITYNFSNQKIITVGELIELDYQVNFRAKIITDADSKYHYTGSALYAGNVKVCGHSSQGAVILSKADYSTSQATRAISEFKYTYINTHPGALAINSDNYSLALNAKLQYRNITESNYSNETIDLGLDSLSTFIEQSGKDRKMAFTFPEGMDAFVCRLVISTTQKVTNGSESYTTTKTMYTNEQAVYNVLPTVSYRKNLLGINATNLYDDGVKNAVLVIGEHSSKNIIYFLSSNGIKKVNTSTGDIDGFVIDGGEW